MNHFLHRHCLLPAFETIYHRRKTFRYWRDLEQSQWLSSAELEQRQLYALRRLLHHAYAHCPYHQAIWQDQGLEPDALESLDAFHCWPTMTRATIRNHRQQMRAQVPGLRLISKATGGSSGEPLGFDLDTGSHDRRTAASHRGYDWAGAGPGAKLLYLWGGAVGDVPASQHLKDRLYHGLYRRKTINCFDLCDGRIEEFLAVHNRRRPDAIVAYTNAIYEFARALAERNLRPYAPQSIVVGAEKLHPFQRTLIERVFQAPVFETYGSREFMLMAAECERHEGLHLTSEHLLLEVLDDEGKPTPPGEEGNVVVTDLFNYGMPFIRYVNGDRAVAGWKPCSCGRGLPLMQPPLGRTLDVLTSPDGRRVPGEFFPHIVKDFPGVRRFQVVQDALDHVMMRVVAANDWSDEQGQAVVKLSRERLGPLVHFELLRVDDIPLTRAGKLRVVVNQCLPTEPVPA